MLKPQRTWFLYTSPACSYDHPLQVKSHAQVSASLLSKRSFSGNADGSLRLMKRSGLPTMLKTRHSFRWCTTSHNPLADILVFEFFVVLVLASFSRIQKSQERNCGSIALRHCVLLFAASVSELRKRKTRVCINGSWARRAVLSYPWILTRLFCTPLAYYSKTLNWRQQLSTKIQRSELFDLEWFSKVCFFYEANDEWVPQALSKCRILWSPLFTSSCRLFVVKKQVVDFLRTLEASHRSALERSLLKQHPQKDFYCRCVVESLEAKSFNFWYYAIEGDRAVHVLAEGDHDFDRRSMAEKFSLVRLKRFNPYNIMTEPDDALEKVLKRAWVSGFHQTWYNLYLTRPDLHLTDILIPSLVERVAYNSRISSRTRKLKQLFQTPIFMSLARIISHNLLEMPEKNAAHKKPIEFSFWELMQRWRFW